MCSPVLHGIVVPGVARAKISAYVDDVYSFLSSCSNIKVVLKAIEGYEKATGGKINRVKSSDLRLCVKKRDDIQGTLIRWTIQSASLEKNFSEVRAKVGAAVAT